MRKVVALSLVAAMALSLAACGETSSSSSAAASSSSAKEESTTSSSSTTEESTTSSSSTEETSTSSSSEETATSSSSTSEEASTDGYTNDDLTGDAAIGTVYEDFDYSSRDTYHIVYFSSGDNLLEHQMLEAYESLQDKYNFEIEYATSDGDDELFITTLNTLIDRGDVDGFIIEANSYQADAVLPLLQECGIPWVNQFTEFYDEDGNLAVPVCIIPQWQSGYDSMEWMCQHYTEYWGDVDVNEIGMITVDYSVSQPLRDRTIGIEDCFKEYINETNIFEEDSYAMGESMWMTTDAGYETCMTIIASHPEVKYWMFSSCLEYYSQGAAQAAEELGIDDSMLISTVGSPMFIEAVESGYEGAWKSTICINNYAYATPIILGVMAICDGRATEESLWPDKHNYFSDNDAYGTWRADYANVTADTYAEYTASIEAKYGP